MAIREHNGRGQGGEDVFYSSGDDASSDAVLQAGSWNTPSYENAAAGEWIRRGRVREVVAAFRANRASAASGCKIEESLDASTAHKTTALADEDGNTTTGVDKLVAAVVEVTLPFWRFSWTEGNAGAATVRGRVTGRP
ncbi:MAG: hypothetical protein WC211_01200 [Dehalococcoidia bacterium]